MSESTLIDLAIRRLLQIKSTTFYNLLGRYYI